MIKEEDKRDFQRMLINAEVAVKAKGKVVYGICRDLSATGMGIAVSELSLKSGDEVSLSLGGNGVPPFNARGNVVRVEHNEYAIEFTDVN